MKRQRIKRFYPSKICDARIVADRYLKKINASLFAKDEYDCLVSWLDSTNTFENEKTRPVLQSSQRLWFYCLQDLVIVNCVPIQTVRRVFITLII